MTDQAESPATIDPLPTTQEARNPIGRPTTYNKATAELICVRLSDGETLTSILKAPGMPSRTAVHKWRMRFPAFEAEYTRARAAGMESMSDEILTISDDDSGDWDAESGKPNSANVQRSRLMVDTRKFLMAKLAPRIYGDKVQHEHSGTVEQRVTLSDRERMRRLATFLAEDSAAGALIDGTASEVVGAGLPASPSPQTLPAAHEPGRMEEPRARDDDV